MVPIIIRPQLLNLTRLQQRWSTVCRAVERNARHTCWWDEWWSGNRSRRVTRMRDLNRALIRIGNVAVKQAEGL